MTLSAPPPDMPDLMAAVGEVLLCWGYVETAILERLATIDGPVAKPPRISPLARWKRAETAEAEIITLQAEVERLAQIRNYLAHRLTSATADPRDVCGPAVVCRTPSGEQRIAFTTLIEIRSSLHRLSHAIRALPRYDKRKSPSE